MKTLKTSLILCATICCFVSCKKEVDMTVMQKTMFENATISQIEVNDGWNVTVVADSNTFVEVEYSAYLENYLKISMEGSKLHVGFTGKVYAEIGSVYRATVHTDKMEELTSKNESNLQFDGVFSGQNLTIKLSDVSHCFGLVFSGDCCEIEMEGISILGGFQFIGSTCKAILEDASQFNGDIQAADQLEVELDGASRFVNKGEMTDVAIVKLQSASLLNMAETQVGEMQVEISSGSEATVHVTNLLSGTLTEASTLYYIGNPEINVDGFDGSQLIPL